MKIRRIYVALMAVAALAAACQKETTPEDRPVVDEMARAYVLNEGLWGNNDGSLTMLDYNSGAASNEYFAAQNGRGLGDVAQTAAIYGSKLYIVVWGSNTLEIAQAADAKALKQISFAGRSPRCVAFYGSKAYVGCYNKYVYAIDTATLMVTDSCRLTGMQPEGMCVAGDKLCVCSGWEYDANGGTVFDNTMSVVDLGTFSEVRKVQVGLNPAKVMAIDGHRVLLNYWGDYGSVKSGLQIVDLDDDTTEELGFEATGFDMREGQVYSYSFSYTTGKTEIRKTDLATKSSTVLEIGEGIKSLYGISVNPHNGDILLTDSRQFRSSGDVHCYSASGAKKWVAEAGKGPSKVIFL